MKYLFKINCFLFFYSLINLFAKPAKNLHKQKNVIDEKQDVSENIAKKIEKKQKKIQLKNLEFEDEISNLRRKIEKLRMQKEYEQAKMEADVIEYQKNKINLRKENEELRLKIEQLKSKLEKAQQELQLANFENEKQLKQTCLKTEQLRSKLERAQQEFQLSNFENEKQLKQTCLKTEQLRSKLEKAQQEFQLANLDTLKKLKLSYLNTSKAKTSLEELKFQSELNKYIKVKTTHPKNPFLKDGTLLISDRTIEMNGFVTMIKANYIVDRINFYNNKDDVSPIFLLIDINLGGSVFAGAKILKAMESSKAPVYVVVKSLAASMAAIITTLAKKSFALPEAQIIHHQPVFEVSNYRANLSEQEYTLAQFKKWSKRFLGKVAKKMGISLDTFMKRMYQNSPNGDWQEFADKAKKLKWVDNIVTGIKYSNINKLPCKKDYTRSKFMRSFFDAEDEQVTLSKDPNGKTLMYIDSLPGEIFFVKNDPRIIIR